MSKKVESKKEELNKAGLHAIIPLCYYCDQPKQEIVMMQDSVAKDAARRSGFPEGDLPMYAHIAGDYIPCDKCREQGIAIIEVDHVNGKAAPNGNAWLVKKKAVLDNIRDPEAKQRAMDHGHVMVSEEIATAWGLHDND